MRPLVTNLSNLGTVTECELGGAPVVQADRIIARLVSTSPSAGPTWWASRAAGSRERTCMGSVSIARLPGSHPSFRRMEGGDASTRSCMSKRLCGTHNLSVVRRAINQFDSINARFWISGCPTIAAIHCL